MTKAEASVMAKRTLRYGYFDRGNRVEVTCPLCRESVGVEHFCGRPQVQKLAPILAEHLVCWCSETVGKGAENDG